LVLPHDTFWIGECAPEPFLWAFMAYLIWSSRPKISSSSQSVGETRSWGLIFNFSTGNWRAFPNSAWHCRCSSRVPVFKLGDTSDRLRNRLRSLGKLQNFERSTSLLASLFTSVHLKEKTRMSILQLLKTAQVRLSTSLLFAFGLRN
jgi:hypothetical protein